MIPSSSDWPRSFVAVALLATAVVRANPSDTLSGAIFTTLSTGTAVNANLYAKAPDVYLNSGPQNQAAEGLPDGTYYFQVTDPSGAVLLSQDAASARQLVVRDGRVAGAAAVEGAHFNGITNVANGALGVQLWPFAPTPNQGGEYKVWLIQQTADTTIDPTDARVLHFSASDSKTDNFKITTVTAPLTIVAPDPVTVCNDAKRDGAVVTLPAVVTSGGVAPVSVTFSQPSGSFFTLGRTDVLATATDATGATTSCTFTVTVNDCEGPRFASGSTPVLTASLPANACAAIVNYDESLFTDPNGIKSVVFTPASGSGFTTGVNAVSYVATDNLGNVSQGSFIVKVADTTAPVIAPLADIEVSTAPGQCSAVVTFAPTATDCSGASVTTSPASGSTFNKGVTVVAVTAVDAYGNASSATFKVTVKDTEKPAINVPASITVGNDPGKCSAIVTYLVNATDNCGLVQLTVDGPASGSAFPKGTTVLTATAVDSSGNVSTATFSVTVNDVEAPSVAAPTSIIDALYTVNGTTESIPAPATTDNCGVASVVGVRSDGGELSAPYPLGTTTITWTATDTSGNTSTGTQTVTILGGAITVAKFYDANANSTADSGESLLGGWKVTLTGTDSAGNPVGPLVGATVTDGSTVFPNLPVGRYTVVEGKSLTGTWVETLPTAQSLPLTPSSQAAKATFGAFALGAANSSGGGALTIGFWSNKNGEKTLSTALAANLAGLSALNLRTATGADFNPTTFASYNTWVLGATATNMATMLSAQLSAMYNNVNVRPNSFGGVNGAALIYAPGATSANANGVLTVSALINEANASLAVNPVTTASSTVRSYQEALKTALDNGNNNRNFVQPSPTTFSF